MARADTDSLVEVLDDLGFLRLDADERSDGLADDEEAFLFDFPAERRAEDLEMPEELGAAPAEFDQLSSGAIDRRRADLERVASRLGGRTPPPLPDPDAFAWYQPIHYYAQAWGVFVREDGIQEVALGIAGFVDTSRDPIRVAAEVQRMAHVVLRLHEAFHHKVESAAIRMETVSGRDTYKPYDDHVFLPLRSANSRSLLEEGLGNAWMLRNLMSDAKGIGDDVLLGVELFLRWWIPTLPGAYGRGVELFEDGIDQHVYRLTEQLHSAQVDPPSRDRLWAVTTHLLDPLHNRLSSHYVVVPRGQVPYLPHVAPPKGLAVGHRELEKMLTRLGWERQKTRGRHPVKFVKDGAKPIPLPIHAGSLPTGTLNKIAREAGFANARELVDAARA
jgi:predicted RNA binding protein YcfA (HicA-like mRNA interferase family)